jgi:CRISPR-associated protein Cas2
MYIIAYDIVKDKTRTKVHKLLKDYGFRVQYSVFETDVTKEEMDKLYKRISVMIDPETDSVIFYFACAACEQKSLQLGKDKKIEYSYAYVI